MNRITAQQARELTELKSEEQTISLEEIYHFILLATEKGIYKITFPAILSETTVMILENDGYLVEFNGFICKIYWC